MYEGGLEVPTIMALRPPFERIELPFPNERFFFPVGLLTAASPSLPAVAARDERLFLPIVVYFLARAF